MPQTGKPENTIQFNYYVGGQLDNLLILNIVMLVKTLSYIKELKKYFIT
jgi:hypothetical protein